MSARYFTFIVPEFRLINFVNLLMTRIIEFRNGIVFFKRERYMTKSRQDITDTFLANKLFIFHIYIRDIHFNTIKESYSLHISLFISGS